MREKHAREERWYVNLEVQAGTDCQFAEAKRGGDRQRQGHAAGLPRAGISEQSYYRWRKAHGALRLDQAKRLKELEKENPKLKRRVAGLSLEKRLLKDVWT